ncbi:MAG: dockerin type I repeat-containing protein [Bacteroidaceae bacterium]|nr:dockerin type I repeat-containing protein [Bacteroidaceae bacterium]
MWASLIEAYRLEVTAAANGKTGSTATLTLNLENKEAIVKVWQCTVKLPDGVTYVDGSFALVPARYPEGYNAEATATVNADGTVTFVCAGEGAITGTAGAVATFDVQIDATVTPGDYVVAVTRKHIVTVSDQIYDDATERPYTWTIEEGAPAFQKGDVNCDGKVDIADAVSVLNAMAGAEVEGDANVNGDENIDIADYVTVLNIMAGAE